MRSYYSSIGDGEISSKGSILSGVKPRACDGFYDT